jgi:23S rRNA-/tRNA-specific pseudouridylate synthase
MDAPSGAFESYLCEDKKTLNVHSVSDPARGKLARTEREVLSEGRGTSLVKVVLKSGRRNQIRVHFAEAGHPVCGDVRYGSGGRRGLCLHAWRLTSVHPRTHESCTFEAPPPVWARLS